MHFGVFSTLFHWSAPSLPTWEMFPWEMSPLRGEDGWGADTTVLAFNQLPSNY